MLSNIRNKKIIISDATSFLNSLIVKELLSLKNYDVVAVVNENKKSCFLENLDGADDRLTVIKDKGDVKYDQLFKDAYAVFHSITPPADFNHKTTNNLSRDLVFPNIDKTVSFMDSASTSDSLKKVILTSSIETALDTTAVDLYKRKNAYNENDWNTSVNKKENPEEYTTFLSEKAAREYKFKNCPEKFELITINPALMIGRGLKGSDMNKHLNLIKNALEGEVDPNLSNRMIGIIDVQDVVKAHIKALESKDHNDSQRYLMANHVTSFHALSGMVKEYTNMKMTKNTPSKSIHNFRIESISNLKLDTPYVDIKTTIVNCIGYLLSLGQVKQQQQQQQPQQQQQMEH